jgi:predicted RNA-binding protein
LQPCDGPYEHAAGAASDLKEKNPDMCEAHAYLIKEGREERILDSVDAVEILGDEVNLISIFGEQKRIKARFKRYVSTEGKMVFEPV